MFVRFSPNVISNMTFGPSFCCATVHVATEATCELWEVVCVIRSIHLMSYISYKPNQKTQVAQYCRYGNQLL